MYIYMAILVLQTGLGLMYVYYEPPLEKFTQEEINSIEAFIKGNEKLPEKLQILAWNDSVGIIGKKSIDGVLRYLPNSKKDPKKSKKQDFFTNKYFAPDDFSSYLKLIGSEEVYGYMSGFFWALQYPDQLIYIYIKRSDCGEIGEDFAPCYYYFDEGFVWDFDFFDPIIWEIIDGKLDDRYRNFYRFFQKLLHPNYVRTDLADDPYFLIYQGKYKEARAGLKDLPPARREFCEKKLEALGY